jgi:uncharacterized damage-inducible protein DinB
MRRMLEMLRDLIGHKGHANAAMVSAIAQHQSAAPDLELWRLLHHILLANRFWLVSILGRPFDLEHESRPPTSLDALIEQYVGTHAQEAEWLAGATEADLERVLTNPLVPGGACSVLQALMQVCLHSHGHRAQCAMRLRQHGGTPPATDFIVWLTTRPAADWTAARNQP